MNTTTLKEISHSANLKRAPPKTPLPHRMNIINRAHTYLSKDSKLNKNSSSRKKIKFLSMKLNILKEVLLFKKAQKRFRENTSFLKSATNPSLYQSADDIKKPKESNTEKLQSNDIHKNLNSLSQHSQITRNNFHQNNINLMNSNLLVQTQKIIYKINENVPSYHTLTNKMKQLLELIVEIMNHVYSKPFNSPVDWIMLKIPDYPQKIKYPIDLGTIKNKLERGKYNNCMQIVKDVRQVWINAQIYNPPSNQYHIMSIFLSNLFETRLKTLNIENIKGLGKNDQYVDQNGQHKNKTKNVYELTEKDIDQATGKVIELSIFEKKDLKNKIMNTNDANALKTIISIIQQDPKYKHIKRDKSERETKIEFEITSLNDSTIKKLSNFVESIPKSYNYNSNGSKYRNSLKSKEIDPNLHIRQINTQISNEFGNQEPTSLLKQPTIVEKKDIPRKMSVMENKQIPKQSVETQLSSSSSEDDDSSNSSSSSESDDSGEEITLKDPASINTSKNTKVLWNWSQNQKNITPFSLNNSQKDNPLKQKTNSLKNGLQNNFTMKPKINFNIKSSIKKINMSVPPPPPSKMFNNKFAVAPSAIYSQRSREFARLEREKQNMANLNLLEKNHQDMQRRFF